jgi:putative flippase GtrA
MSAGVTRSRSFRAWLLETIRFGAVGGSTAALYFLLVWLLAKVLTLQWWIIATLASGPPLLASYLLHRSFTFNSSREHKSSGPRFLIVQGGAVVLNAVVIWLGTDLGKLPFVPVQLGAIAVQVAFTYVSQKYFVFS